VISKISKIEEVLQKSNFLIEYVPFQSSILIIFDRENPKNSFVKLIDFGRTYEVKDVENNVLEEQKPSIFKAIENIKSLITSTKKKYYAKRGPRTKWVDADIDKEFEELQKAEASNDVNKFFSQLYQNADLDTRRAMEKSMAESNGTVLTTNWTDVKDRKVEMYKDKDETTN